MSNILISTAELAALRMVLKSARAWATAEAAERGQAIAGAGLRLAIEEHDMVMMDQHEDQSDDKLCPGCERVFLVDDFAGVGLCSGCLARQRPTAGPPEPPRPVPPEPSRADSKAEPQTFDVPDQGAMTTEQVAEWLNSNPDDPMSYSVVKPGVISATPPKTGASGSVEVITTEPIDAQPPPPLCSGCGYRMLIYEDCHRCPDCNITIPRKD